MREINEPSAHLPHDGDARPDYESDMSGSRRGVEVLQALLVLALVFLNFAHQPAIAASAHDVLTVVASQSFCGSPMAGDDAHAPCHACRVGAGADLPPITALPFPPLPVALSLGINPAPLRLAHHAPLPAGARAPPVA
ncbi:MAG: hypothetical protein EOP19_16375 [Hyphomicrobiales bacterium]|nr:MAG: hypothetical protein EOP19_16375 [Hyphomicrobiales bacterium]